MDTLAEVARVVNACTDCQLHVGRTNAVPGEGPDGADLLFIGEGPGFHEDRQGRPFVGPAGNFLEDLLQSIGMTRDQVFIANMVKCRPPDNRDPVPNEIAACSKYLDRQIELLDPLLIVTLGRFSTARFIPGQSISRVRGRLRRIDGRHIFPIMHPAAGLRRQEMRAAIEEDFAKIPGLMDVLRIQSEPASENAQIREAASSFEPAPSDQTRSLWDVLAPSEQEDAAPLPEPPTTDETERPNDPPPGQQRLF